ncbi:MAG: hypothetical protein H7201_08550 [Candidatus Saccharibacteria bacterium]|nr:hypothetical protein [Microbacteriaceae bacterium]
MYRLLHRERLFKLCAAYSHCLPQEQHKQTASTTSESRVTPLMKPYGPTGKEAQRAEIHKTI